MGTQAEADDGRHAKQVCVYSNQRELSWAVSFELHAHELRTAVCSLKSTTWFGQSLVI